MRRPVRVLPARLRPRRARALHLGLGLGLSLNLSLAGCSGDKVAAYEPATDPAQLYMSLTLNHHAITLAAGPGATSLGYDTLQLTATPRNARGEPITDLPAPRFYSSDTSAVWVDSMTGLLTARQPTTGVTITAELRAAGNVRHADIAQVNVTEPPAAPFGALTLAVAPSDSAVWALDPPATDSLSGGLDLYTAFFAGAYSNTALVASALDAAQQPLSGLVLEFRSLDSSVVAFDVSGRWTGYAHPQTAGQTQLVVEATAYGVTKTATLSVTVTPPVVMTVPIRTALGSAAPGTSLFGGDLTIRTHGVVMWLNALDRPVELVHDDPAAALPASAAFCDAAKGVIAFPFFGGSAPRESYCAGGNLTLAPPDSATRSAIFRTAYMQQFAQAGTYTVHDTQSGATGWIIVTDAPSP